jgi:hypothetical protein
MARHHVEIVQPPKRVLNSDFTFVVYSDGVKLGELLVSKGSVDWWPANRRTGIKKTWEAFARLMES